MSITTPIVRDDTITRDRRAGEVLAGWLPTPQGRLTLVSGTRVMVAAVSAAPAVLWTPTPGGCDLEWDGTGFVVVQPGELTAVLSDATKSPAAAGADRVYDLFRWRDGTTSRLSRGPDWTVGTTAGSNASRGAGAGSTALKVVGGVEVNAFDIANGPAAGCGVFVGTVLTDFTGATLSFTPAAAASTGGTANLPVWNRYNRRRAFGRVTNTAVQWDYSGSAIREVQGSNFRVRFVTGLAEDVFDAEYQALAGPPQAVNAQGFIGVRLNDASGMDRRAKIFNSTTNLSYASVKARAVYDPVLGENYVAATEVSDGSSDILFFGNVDSLLSLSLQN